MKHVSLIVILASCFFLFGVSNSAYAASMISIGSQGADVQVLQQKLSEYGFYSGIVDGVFGRATQTAVISFQASCGLDPDGAVGPATWEKLRSYRGQAVSRGSSRRGGQIIVDNAVRYLGTPYVWAGSGPGGFDCSGFVTYIFSLDNINLPRMADEQYSVGRSIAVSQLLPGDLLFFSTYEPGPSHVGIYMGNGNFIHASSGAGKVTITSLASSYYQSRYLGARRII